MIYKAPPPSCAPALSRARGDSPLTSDGSVQLEERRNELLDRRSTRARSRGGKTLDSLLDLSRSVQGNRRGIPEFDASLSSRCAIVQFPMLSRVARVTPLASPPPSAPRPPFIGRAKYTERRVQRSRGRSGNADFPALNPTTGNLHVIPSDGARDRFLRQLRPLL